MKIVSYKIGPWLGKSEFVVELPATGFLWWKKPARTVTFVGRCVEWVALTEDGGMLTTRSLFGDGHAGAELELCDAWSAMTDKGF